jgi:hypothetical protein
MWQQISATVRDALCQQRRTTCQHGACQHHLEGAAEREAFVGTVLHMLAIGRIQRKHPQAAT